MDADFRPSYGFVRKRGVAITSRDPERVHLAAREPVDLAAVQELQRRVQQPITVQRLDPADFERLINQLYAGGHDEAAQVAEDLAGDLGEELDLVRLAEDLPEPSDLLESEDDAPIIRLINGVLAQALREGASDIHVEPFERRLSIRFRVDGVLREVMSPARPLAGLITSRIKVMARLDIAEKRLPQDGRISLRLAGRPVDVRVSTLPSSHGERVVMRLLDKQAGPMGLADLGMDMETEQGLSQLIARPHGILLVTGPTGSGKTTTLYAALQQLNDRSRNIMTVEDPIEYELDGIGQTQVNPKVDLTFARGLRAILRQDPDVVMIGEIRDLETARIAVQASLTGHLVLATLHTNTAVGAITRLVDMGIEPFLLSSSVIGVLAQRLVRVIDPSHSEAVTLSAEALQGLGVAADAPLTVHRPRADLQLGQSAYQGRTGVYELVTVDAAMQHAIHGGAGEHELERLARQSSPALFDDGLRLVAAGRTSLEEVLRVTRAS
jgi:general secretion pathway protein E